MGKLSEYFNKFLALLGFVDTALDEVNKELDKAAEGKAKVEEIRRKAKDLGK